MAEGARLESVYTLTRIEGSNPSLSANTQNNRFSETGFFMPGALSFRAFQPVQAYLAILIQPRHWSALPPPSWADILCDSPSEAYPSSAVITLALAGAPKINSERCSPDYVRFRRAAPENRDEHTEHQRCRSVCSARTAQR